MERISLVLGNCEEASLLHSGSQNQFLQNPAASRLKGVFRRSLLAQVGVMGLGVGSC